MRTISVRKRLGLMTLVFSGGLLALLPAASPQNVRAREEAARIVTVEKIAITDNVVSGEVLNRSPNVIRDIQLLIRYTWLWDNETKPGKDDPSTSIYYALPKEIPPGGRLPFTYKPSLPLPKMAGGRFETSASIAGFAEVIQQTR
jgi:hypothetical protein